MQHCTDRLDPSLVPIRVDDALLLVSFGSWLTDPASTREKIDVAHRISFARFSSAFSRSSWRTRSGDFAVLVSAL